MKKQRAWRLEHKGGNDDKNERLITHFSSFPFFFRRLQTRFHFFTCTWRALRVALTHVFPSLSLHLSSPLWIHQQPPRMSPGATNNTKERARATGQSSASLVHRQRKSKREKKQRIVKRPHGMPHSATCLKPKPPHTTATRKTRRINLKKKDSHAHTQAEDLTARRRIPDIKTKPVVSWQRKAFTTEEQRDDRCVRLLF